LAKGGYEMVGFKKLRKFFKKRFIINNSHQKDDWLDHLVVVFEINEEHISVCNQGNYLFKT